MSHPFPTFDPTSPSLPRGAHGVSSELVSEASVPRMAIHVSIFHTSRLPLHIPFTVRSVYLFYFRKPDKRHGRCHHFSTIFTLACSFPVCACGAGFSCCCQHSVHRCVLFFSWIIGLFMQVLEHGLFSFFRGDERVTCFMSIINIFRAGSSRGR